MDKIELLDEHLINQIKAGEVVESPHSMLKELIENSIDAKSSEIKIHIKNNGLDLVEIKDNGEGISFDQLPLAFSRHATSKIKSFGDIYQIYSYGFRGEALASISSVSKVKCISNHEKSLSAGKIEIHGGETISHEILEQSISGTVISIQNLFYNTPARLKFIKTSRALRNQINQIIYSFVLTHPSISFYLKFDDDTPIIFERIQKEKEILISSRAKQVITHLRSHNIKRILTRGSFSHESHQFELFISPEASKGGHRHQYIFVNNRLVEDKKIKAIIQRKMSPKIWPIGNSGDYFLFLKIPANLIDPNVHPSKTVIKFIFPEIVESGVAHMIDGIPIPSTNITSDKIDKSSNTQSANKHTVQLQDRTNPSAPIARVYDTGKNIHQKSNRLFIAEFSENEINIIHKGLVIKQFIINSSRSFDGETLPLLVALKLSISPSNDFLKELNHFGFEIEKDHTKETFFLKEIPMYLSQIEDLDTVVKIVEYFYAQNKNHQNFQQYLLDMPTNIFEIKDKVAEKIITENINFLDTNLFTRTLSQESVDKLFNESPL